MSLCPILVTGGTTRSSGKSCSWTVRMECAKKNHLKLVAHSFFLPYPCHLDKSQFLQHQSGEGAFIHRWGDPKEGGWRGKLQHQETWGPQGFSELFQPRGCTSFGSSRHSFTARGRACIWRLWADAEGKRFARSMGQGSLAGMPSPAPSGP